MTTLSARIMDRAGNAMIFRTAEMTHWMGVSQPLVSRALGDLKRRGQLARVMQGLWANPNHARFTPYRLIPYIVKPATDNAIGGYLSTISALAFHGMLSQIPATIHVVVAQRRRALRTAVGEFQFHLLSQELFDGYKPGDAHAYFNVATPAKALFDTLYFSVRKGARWRYLPEVELPRSVTDVAMQGWISRLQTDRLQVAVDARWQELRRKAKGG